MSQHAAQRHRMAHPMSPLERAVRRLRSIVRRHPTPSDLAVARLDRILTSTPDRPYRSTAFPTTVPDRPAPTLASAFPPVREDEEAATA